MDPLDTLTVADWRRVYERSQERVKALLDEGVAARRREAELVDRLRRREEENQRLSEQSALRSGRVDRLEASNRSLREGRDRERVNAAKSSKELEDENQKLRDKLWNIALVRAYTNEDGKSFVFTDDLLVAAGDITPEALERAREIAGEET
ncbi:hypothetical protein ABZ234_03515 [Nocardiopsis sp. NPDC006198]|uniref:hypothetical protein n=1 Tax=Nocardiopsis sp. NPDC006198 TaxID=3154472 RepID=UPI0033AB623C